LNRHIPTIMRMFRQGDAALTAHDRYEAQVGGGSTSAFDDCLLSGLEAAVCWIPISLLAMLAGAVAFSPLKLVSGGLALAQTETGQWLLRQSWPRLVCWVMAIEVLGQAYLLGGFVTLKALFRRFGFKGNNPEIASAAVMGACHLSFLLVNGFAWMPAAPMLGIQLSLFYAYARSRTLLVPAAANLFLGLASLYSARMVVLLTADLGSVDSLPGIPGAKGVLAVLGLSLGLFAGLSARCFCAETGWGFLRAGISEQWQRLRLQGISWSRPANAAGPGPGGDAMGDRDLPGQLCLLPCGVLVRPRQ
jgi:hypothetical protein